MNNTTHHSTKGALATSAQHFAMVGGMTYTFHDEDACWRFIHGQRDCFRHDPQMFLDATYFTRRMLEA